MKKSILSLLAGIFLWIPLVTAQGYTVETVPNTKLTTNSYVSNPDGSLSEATVSTLNSQLKLLEDSTSNQVAVVVLKSIGDQVPKEFATALFNKWGIGLKGKDNGLLVLLILDQRRVEFETGYGMEAILPDATCKRIQETYMVPRFKEGNIDQGVLDGITATIDIMQNKENSTYFIAIEVPNIDTSYSSSADSDAAFGWSIFFFLATVLTLGIVFIVKNQSNSFEENYSKATKEQKEKITLLISKKRWLILYVLPSTLILLAMITIVEPRNFVLTMIGIYYVYFILLLIEKLIRSNKHYKSIAKEKDYYGNYNKYTNLHAYWWMAAVFFPVPFLFYIFYYLKERDRLRNHPRDCNSCSSPLLKLSEVADDNHLSKSELLEEQLKSVDYDVWYCGGCSSKQVLSYKNVFSKYSDCSKCKTRAYYLYSNVTLEAATYDSTGTGEKTYKCKFCGHTSTETYTIPKKERSSSSSSGGNSGGSWGGGSSGGGGSGSSW